MKPEKLLSADIREEKSGIRTYRKQRKQLPKPAARTVAGIEKQERQHVRKLKTAKRTVGRR